MEFLQENLQKNMQEKDKETQGGAGKNPAPLHQAKTPRCETRKSCYSGSSGSTGGRFHQSGKSKPIYIKVYYRNEQKLYCHHAFIPLHILYTYLNRYWSQLTSRHWKLTRSSCSRWLQTSDSAINRSNHIGYVWSWNNWSWWVF